MAAAMLSPERVVLRDEHRYIAHPHMVRLAGGSWLLMATSGPRRAVALHPPLDPAFITIGVWSHDEGGTWSDPAPLPGHGVTGTECGGLTALPDGGVLLNQWRFRWYADTGVARGSVQGPVQGLADGPAADVQEPLLTSADDLRRELEASLELDGAAPEGTIAWARGGGSLTLWRTEPGSMAWTKIAEPDLRPFSGGYGLRGGVFAANGDLLMPLTDPPHYRSVFLIRSRDQGRSWDAPEPVAQAMDCAFEEPAPVRLDDGRLLILLRENVGRRLHAVWSNDHGVTWSAPKPTGLAGFPAHGLVLADGRLAALTALRDAPGAILLTLSENDGETWNDPPVVIASHLGTRDLGYPTAVQANDGSLHAAYYRRDALGVTGVHSRRVQVPHHH